MGDAGGLSRRDERSLTVAILAAWRFRMLFEHLQGGSGLRRVLLSPSYFRFEMTKQLCSRFQGQTVAF